MAGVMGLGGDYGKMAALHENLALDMKIRDLKQY